MPELATLATISAYAGMVFSIIAVTTQNEKRQKNLFVAAAFLLVLGTLAIGDPVLSMTQGVIFFAAITGATGLSQKINALVTVGLGILAFVLLLNAEDAPRTPSFFSGIGGLLLIAVGIALTPWRLAYLALAAGSILIVFYGWSVSAWPRFFLNMFFALLALRRLLEKPKKNPAS